MTYVHRAMIPGFLLLAAVTVPLRADLVTNGSFESPALSSNTYCITFTSPVCPVVSGWTGNFYVANGAGFGGSAPTPVPDGTQYAMVQATGFADQPITITQAGNYTLSWSDAGRGDFITASGNQTYDVRFGGSLLQSFATTSGSAWASHSLSFSTGTGTFTLEFLGTKSFAVGDNSAFLDKIQLNLGPATGAVPEPSMIPLLGIVIGGLAFCHRRRRHSLRIGDTRL